MPAGCSRHERGAEMEVIVEPRVPAVQQKAGGL